MRITEDLIRKRCEHNDGEIGSLEELSLHQEDIEKIEHLQNWCRELRILLLHSNLINKIENLGKLKKLEYINFSLNNIEKIENLQGCESLQKLDFTLNFIGDLTSIESLKSNIHLENLYLTGNPCTDYKGYRDYVISTLPQLKFLDGTEILRSERIKANQNKELKSQIIKQQEAYKVKRNKEKLEKELQKSGTFDDEVPATEEQIKSYWSQMSDNSPESRVEIAKKGKLIKEANKKKKEEPKEKRIIRFFSDNNRPLNVNQAKIPFHLEDNSDSYVLSVEVYKHLDTELVEVDVQPWYVRVTVKGKPLQLVLMEEVAPDRSRAQRSLASGHLLITMPKVHGVVEPVKKPITKEKQLPKDKKDSNDDRYLEVMEARPDLLMIVGNDPCQDFIDDPSVPPLE